MAGAAVRPTQEAVADATPGEAGWGKVFGNWWTSWTASKEDRGEEKQKQQQQYKAKEEEKEKEKEKKEEKEEDGEKEKEEEEDEGKEKKEEKKEDGEKEKEEEEDEGKEKKEEKEEDGEKEKEEEKEEGKEKEEEKEEEKAEEEEEEEEEEEDDCDVDAAGNSQVLTVEQTFQCMMECVAEVNEVIQNPVTVTRILLCRLKWNKEKLVEWYFDEKLDAVFSECRRAIDPAEEVDCDMPCQCYADLNLPEKDVARLDCGHVFSTRFLGGYLRTKIAFLLDSRDEAGEIPCPAHGCDKLVDDVAGMRLLRDLGAGGELAYQRLITNSFVAHNPLLRWCPAPDCNHAVKVQRPGAEPVSCKCGRRFCFGCGEDCHEPATCELLRKWLKKLNEQKLDGDSAKWIQENTKECPKCHVTIEMAEEEPQVQREGYKRRKIFCVSCAAEFCWFCMSPWVWLHLCDPCADVSEVVTDASSPSRRFLFHYNRYMEHMQRSLGFQGEHKAAEELRRCHSTLALTYALGFYLKENLQSVILESNRARLEDAAKDMADYLAKEEKIAVGHQDVMQKVMEGRQKQRALLEHVRECYEKELWEYSED